MNWRPRLYTRLISLAAALVSLSSSLPVSFAKEPTIGKPLTLSKSEIAQGVTIKSQKMIISLEVDHGTVKKIGVLRSTGDPKLDTAAVRWVKGNWIFKKDLSGRFQLPVEFSKKE